MYFWYMSLLINSEDYHFDLCFHIFYSVTELDEHSYYVDKDMYCINDFISKLLDVFFNTLKMTIQDELCLAVFALKGKPDALELFGFQV